MDRLFGLRVSEKETVGILNRLEFRVTKKKNRQYLVEIPTFRQDIELEEDLVEEVGRIYGYDKISEKAPLVSFSLGPRREYRDDLVRLLRTLLQGIGYSETYNLSFYGEKEIGIMRFSTSNHYALENPVSEEYAYLRTSLLPLILENVSRNLPHIKGSIRLFELGKVYSKSRLPSRREKTILSIVYSGRDVSEGFYTLKGEIEWIFSSFGIADVSFVEIHAKDKKWWHPTRSAAIHLGGKRIGVLGELNPLFLERFGIKRSVIAGELDWDAILLQAIVDERVYQPLPRYPATLRDIALFVSFETRVADVLNVIQRVGGEWVRDVDLFDMYEGEELPEGVKNLAFHVVYQKNDRTLSSGEVDELHRKIGKALEKELGAEIRK